MVSATIKMDNENKSPSMETVKLSYKYLDSPIWNLNSFGEVSSEGELSYESTSMDLKLSIPVATTKVLDNFIQDILMMNWINFCLLSSF